MSGDKKIILIAIDGSENSEQAFHFYCENLHRDNHELLLIHNGEIPCVNASYQVYTAGDLWKQLLEKEKEKVVQLEDKYSKLMEERKLSGKIRAVFGHKAGETIVHEANESKCTMIVMGTRGLGTLRRTILGSVSDYVVHHAHCPVVVCRH